MQKVNSNYNILVVEDDKRMSYLIERCLSKNKQYEVQVADKIKWARQALEKTYFDLICLDLLLPDGNGIDLCKELKKSDEYKSTKIIVISKINQVINKVEAFKFGADEYLIKPFHPHELDIRVKKHLGLIGSGLKNIKYKNLTLDTRNMRFLHNSYEIPLTKTEFLLLQYLFEHEGFGNLNALTQFLSSKKFIDINNKSVIVSVNRLKKKLKTNTGNPFIKTKYGIGYYIP